MDLHFCNFTLYERKVFDQFMSLPPPEKNPVFAPEKDPGLAAVRRGKCKLPQAEHMDIDKSAVHNFDREKNQFLLKNMLFNYG